jgi:glycosyltransferase involved in cell wall biosynthesis
MEPRAPVSCCLIVKNEIAQIESCLKSVRPYVEEIVVVDTGSTDGSFEVCAKYADIHERFSDCNDSEGRILDFSMARQRSFDLARQPWVMWVDGDDEVQGAEKIGQLISGLAAKGMSGPTLLMFPYEYSHDAAGNVTCLHYRERVCTPKEAFKWVNPVHEVLSPVGGMNMVKTDEVRMIHRRFQSGKTIEPGRNLRILKAYYDRVGDSDVRQLYYLGLEYANAGDLRTSIEFHKKYVARSGWDDEKCLACLEIAKHHQTFGEYDQAIEWALRATTVKENWGETYFSLGKSYYFIAQRGGADAKRNWERSVGFFRLGLNMPVTETILFVNPMERNLEIHKFLNIALNSMGDVAGALESAMIGLRADPLDEGLKMNAGLYEEHLAKIHIEENLLVLLGRNKITMDVASFVKEAIHGRVQVKATSVPSPEQEAPALPPVVVGPTPTSVFEQTRHPMDIIMYVGPGVEPWTPSTFGRTGLGGSETMAWEMARRLAAIGNRVRLFGDCAGMEGNFEGVEFLHHEKYKDLSCDVLLTSRRPHVVDDVFGVKARARLCWVHDVHCGDGLNHARALRLDRVLCLSRWHADVVRNTYRFLHPSQVIVTRNGIDLSRFAGGGPRNPHKMVYSSSPDRGLQTAIVAMPAIRQRVPDAELHVFYGFKTWEASARANGAQDQMNIIALLKRLLEEGKPHGVHFHDRVDQARLAREFTSAGVWGYPTWFTETSCITAMEAQAAGLRVITSPIAALTETVADRGKMINGDWLSPEYKVAYVDAVVDAMTRTDDSDRVAMAEFAARNFGLDSLAVEWDEMLHRVIDEVERDIVVPYQVVA